MSLRLKIALLLLLFTPLVAGYLFWGRAAVPHGTRGYVLIFTGLGLPVIFALFTAAAHWVGRPLRLLSQASRHIANGDFMTPLPQGARGKIGQLTRDFAAMQARLALRENRLSENEARLRAIIDHSSAALVTIDSSGTLRSFNKAAERIFGYKADDVVGESIRRLMPMPVRANHDEYIRRYLQTGVKSVIDSGREVQGKRINGEVFPLWIDVSEVKTANNRLFVGSLQEITQQKRADAELAKHRENLRTMIHERTKDLKVAMEKAEAANQAKSNFISNISHEIRTPMNAMLGFLALALENTGLPKELRGHLDVAHRSAWSLLGLLDDILDISKLEGGRMSVEFTPFALHQVLQEITTTMEIAAREKGLTLALTIAPGVPTHCSGDPMRLRQVLFNLLSNAIKFTPKGRVGIHAEPYHKGHIHFYIHDTGIGIPASQLNRIFEPFAQADDSSTRRYGGTGLGTSISKQLVGLMGGALWVESELGTGSTFHFTLPLPETVAQPSLPLPCNTPSSATPLDRLSILVAEDIPENAKLIMIRLSQQGHRATAAANGKEVFDALSKEPFDLILMDVHMPELDGLRATRDIRMGAAGTTCRRIPIIGLTASAGHQDIADCLDAGMDDVVTKPIDFKNLYASIGGVISALPQLAPPLSATTGWPRIAGVDTQQAMAAWQSKPQYLEALTSFVHKFVDAPASMLQIMEEGHADTLGEQIHAIKGASANLYMTEVHAACQALAPLLTTGDQGAMRPLLNTMAEAFKRLFQALPTGVEDQPTTEHPNIPSAQIQEWFDALLHALATDNPDRVEPLLTPRAACVSAAAAQRIRDEVNVFNFRGAEEEARRTAREINVNLQEEAPSGETENTRHR